MLYIIEHYLGDCYYLYKIDELNGYGKYLKGWKLICIQGIKQIWVAGLINNNWRKIWLEILPNKSANTMKK